MPLYHITITKVESRNVTRKGEWGTIDERPWTEEELNNNAHAYNTESFLEKEPLKKVYGYKPDVTASEKVETKVLEQTVEDMDITAVIKAINKID